MSKILSSAQDLQVQQRVQTYGQIIIISGERCKNELNQAMNVMGLRTCYLPKQYLGILNIQVKKELETQYIYWEGQNIIIFLELYLQTILNLLIIIIISFKSFYKKNWDASSGTRIWDEGIPSSNLRISVPEARSCCCFFKSGILVNPILYFLRILKQLSAQV